MTKPLDRRAAGRAIKYAGAIGGMSLDEINELLRTVGIKEMPKSSFEMIRATFVPLFLEDSNALGANIRSPDSMSKLAARRAEKI